MLLVDFLNAIEGICVFVAWTEISFFILFRDLVQGDLPQENLIDAFDYLVVKLLNSFDKTLDNFTALPLPEYRDHKLCHLKSQVQNRALFVINSFLDILQDLILWENHKFWIEFDLLGKKQSVHSLHNFEDAL